MRIPSDTFHYKDEYGDYFFTVTIVGYGQEQYILISIIIATDEIVVRDHIVVHHLDDLNNYPPDYFHANLKEARKHPQFFHYFKMFVDEVYTTDNKRDEND
jgi:hypothetical protein